MTPPRPPVDEHAAPVPGAGDSADARDGGRFASRWEREVPRAGRRTWHELAMVVALFLGLAALVLWRAWTPVAADRLAIGGADGDFLRQFLPYRAWVAATWAGGHLPLWNPHQYAGTPALADPQLAVVYPWRVLQVPFAVAGRTLPLVALVAEAVAHLALAGALTYGLARALGGRRSAALLAGVTFALSSFLTGYPVDQLAVLDSAAWLPGILWGLVIATRGRDQILRRRGALSAAGATALSLLAGHPQTTAFGMAAGAAWLTAELVRGGRPARSKAQAGVARATVARATVARATVARGALARGAALWLVAAAGLSAVQWLPSLRFVEVSARALSRAERLAGLPIADVAQMVAPHGLSRWSPLYVGLLPLGLVAWGLVRAPASRYWAALAGVGWLWSLGGNGPLVSAVVAVAPDLLPFRHQERAAVLVALGLAVAAGLSAEALLRARDKRDEDARRHGELLPAWLLAAVGVVLSVLTARTLVPLEGAALTGHWPMRDAMAHGALWALLSAIAVAWLVTRRPKRTGGARVRATGLVLVLVCALDLLSANTGHALGPWPAPTSQSGPILAALEQRAKDGRVSSQGALPGGANAAMMHGLYDVTGDSPLHLAGVQRLVDEAPEIAWWRLLGVRYVLRTRPPNESEAGLLAPLSDVAAEGTLYEIGLPAPPVWTTPATRCVSPIADWLPEADLDPLSVVVVDPQGRASGRSTNGTDRPEADMCTPRMDGVVGSVQLVGLDPGRAAIEAVLPEGAWVVWSSAWDPSGGWHARASEADGQVLRPPPFAAYGVLPAVWLPAGSWRIEWTYRPPSVMLGILTSLLSLGLAAVHLRTGSGPWRRPPRPTR